MFTSQRMQDLKYLLDDKIFVRKYSIFFYNFVFNNKSSAYAGLLLSKCLY